MSAPVSVRWANGSVERVWKRWRRWLDPKPFSAGSENLLLRSSTAPNNACIRDDRRLAPHWPSLLLSSRGRTPAGDTTASLAPLPTSDTRSRIRLSATCCAGTGSHLLRNGVRPPHGRTSSPRTWLLLRE